MKIAILFDNFGPYHVARLAAASGVCDLLGIEVAGRSSEYEWLPTHESPGFERATLLDQRASEATDRRLLTVRLDQVLRSFRPDVVAIPGWSSRAAMVALRWCARRCVPAILMSDSQAIDEPRRALKERVKRHCVSAFSAALVGGRSHRQYLVQLGMAADQVFLGYDVVDNEYFARGATAARADENATRSKLSLPARYFLASNRFIPKKNLLVVLRAFARYRSEAASAPWSLVVLGDGPLRADIEQSVASLGLQDSVQLPGFKQYPELPAYYGLAGAFVHASTTEQWGLVVNEAMASGLPVIVSNRCGCTPELVNHGTNGYLFDPNDEAALARWLAQIAGDDARRSAMGQASRERILNWGPDRFASGLRMAAECASQFGAAPRRLFDDLVFQFIAARNV